MRARGGGGGVRGGDHARDAVQLEWGIDSVHAERLDHEEEIEEKLGHGAELRGGFARIRNERESTPLISAAPVHQQDREAQQHKHQLPDEARTEKPAAQEHLIESA